MIVLCAVLVSALASLTNGPAVAQDDTALHGTFAGGFSWASTPMIGGGLALAGSSAGAPGAKYSYACELHDETSTGSGTWGGTLSCTSGDDPERREVTVGSMPSTVTGHGTFTTDDTAWSLTASMSGHLLTCSGVVDPVHQAAAVYNGEASTERTIYGTCALS